jgi:hypothetical protein
MVNENCSLIVAQGKRPQQLCLNLNLVPSPQAIPEASPYLQIAAIPIAERINPKENRYILLILPQRVRATAGQYDADEAFEIARLTRGWDWELDEHSRPKCLGRLEQLLDQICKKSATKGGEE